MESNKSTLRVLRHNDTAEPPIEPVVEVTSSPDGLHGFTSEDTPVQQIEASQPRLVAAPSPQRHSPPWLVGVLLALVIAESVPAALWARDYLSGASTVGVTPPPLITAVSPPPASAEAIAPCEAPAVISLADAVSKPAVPSATVAAGGSTSPAAGSSAIAAGVLSVVAPLTLNVYNRGRLIGTSEAESIMLPLGSYDLELVNDAVGYRTRKLVTLHAGRKTMLQIDPPRGTLHVNALPWAEVWVDNQRLGETPIGNAQVPVGSRELVFRHPELGERRTRVLVTLKEPTRVSIDLRKQ